MTDKNQIKLFKRRSSTGPSEATISKSIEEYLDLRGIYNDRLNSGLVQQVKRHKGKDGKMTEFRNWVRLCKEGTPDRYFIVAGRIFFVEVKRKGGLLRPNQAERIAQLQAAGAVVFVVDSRHSFEQQFIQHFQNLVRRKKADG